MRSRAAPDPSFRASPASGATSSTITASGAAPSAASATAARSRSRAAASDARSVAAPWYTTVESEKRSLTTTRPASRAGRTRSATSCARDARKRKVSAARSIGVPPRSRRRISSPAGVPPGSRTRSTARPRPSSARASRAACVDFPEPSGPSRTMKVPFGTGGVYPPLGSRPGERASGPVETVWITVGCHRGSPPDSARGRALRRLRERAGTANPGPAVKVPYQLPPVPEGGGGSRPGGAIVEKPPGGRAPRPPGASCGFREAVRPEPAEMAGFGAGDRGKPRIPDICRPTPCGGLLLQLLEERRGLGIAGIGAHRVAERPPRLLLAPRRLRGLRLLDEEAGDRGR